MDISVVIPCHNAGRYVSAALDSVRAQALPAKEVVVVDDGSSDDSVERVRASTVGARLLRTPGGLNAAGARNLGIEHATGEWVAFLDADDVWYPFHLQRVVALLSGTSDVAVIGHCDLYEHTTGRTAASRPFEVGRPTAGLSHEAFLRLWSRRGHFPNSGVVARRDVVRAVGGFDVAQVRRHDFELFLRLVHGRTWGYDPRPSWRYQIGTPNAVSNHAVSCAYFSLRAVVKNEPAYRGRVMAGLVRKKAQAAMAAAYAAGTAEDRRRAWDLARPHLTLGRRALYTALHPLAGTLHRWAARSGRGTKQIRTLATANPAVPVAATAAE